MSISEIFGEVIYSYTRAQALEDGVLVDVSSVAREAGIKFPCAITRAAWDRYCEVHRGRKMFKAAYGTFSGCFAALFAAAPEETASITACTSLFLTAAGFVSDGKITKPSRSVALAYLAARIVS